MNCCSPLAARERSTESKSGRHARAIIGRDDAEALAQRIVDEGLNVRDVEALVSEPAPGEDGGETGSVRRVREKDADTRAFEKELSEALGLRVEIKKGSGESGVLTIKYANFDQLDYIRQRISGG